jgi:hypothetical protein
MSFRQAPTRLLFLAAAVVACSGDATRTTGPAPQPPTISEVGVTPNPNSTISFIVGVTSDHADSIRIRYESAADSSDATPFYRVVSHAPTAVAVVGLRALTRYSFVAEAIGPGGRVVSLVQSATTGELPLPLQTLHLVGTGSATAGYTLVAPLFSDTSLTADGFLVAFDQLGVIRW